GELLLGRIAGGLAVLVLGAVLVGPHLLDVGHLLLVLLELLLLLLGGRLLVDGRFHLLDDGVEVAGLLRLLDRRRGRLGLLAVGHRVHEVAVGAFLGELRRVLLEELGRLCRRLARPAAALGVGQEDLLALLGALGSAQRRRDGVLLVLVDLEARQ